MSIEGELARAGIITLDTETVFTKDVKISEDLLVAQDLTVTGDSSFEGNVTIAGVLTGTVEGGSYVLVAKILDLSAAGGIWVPIPTGGDGYISSVRAVAIDAIGTLNPVLSTNVNGGTDLIATYDVSFTAADPAGTVRSSAAIPQAAANNTVAAGDAVQVYPSVVSDTVDVVEVLIQITRT